MPNEDTVPGLSVEVEVGVRKIAMSRLKPFANFRCSSRVNMSDGLRKMIDRRRVPSEHILGECIRDRKRIHSFKMDGNDNLSTSYFKGPYTYITVAASPQQSRD